MTIVITIKIEPKIKTSFVVAYSLPATIAICGIEGGVAKAKLAIIPIIAITIIVSMGILVGGIIFVKKKVLK